MSIGASCRKEFGELMKFSEFATIDFLWLFAMLREKPVCGRDRLSEDLEGELFCKPLILPV